MDRCERAIIEACKQCGRAQRMIMTQPRRISEALWSALRPVVDADPYHDDAVQTDQPVNLTLAIGPEGGFSPRDRFDAVSG